MKFPVKLKGTLGELVQAVLAVLGIVSLIAAFGLFLGEDYRTGAVTVLFGVVVLYIFYPRDAKS